jgi:hypothetical protein
MKAGGKIPAVGRKFLYGEKYFFIRSERNFCTVAAKFLCGEKIVSPPNLRRTSAEG